MYNNYNPLLVGLAVERAVDTTLAAFLSEAIWAPMGAEADASWSLDRADGGLEKMESGFNARARDLARFGLLYLRGGLLLGEQILVVRLGRHDGDLDWRSFMAAVAKRVRADIAEPMDAG